MLNSIRQYKPLTASLFLFVFLGTVFFPSAGRDDDYIVFWSAGSLVDSGRLVNYNGEHIEQASSLGHTLLLAIASGISRLPVPSIAVPISVISGVILLFLLNGFRRFFEGHVVNYALLITATSFPFLYWSFSGLETSLYTLTLTFFGFIILAATRNQVGIRDYSYLFLVVLSLQLIRPEAFFVIGLVMGLYWLIKLAREAAQTGKTSGLLSLAARSRSTRFSLIVILFDFIVFAVIGTFRYFYFNSIFPQPVVSKVSGIFPGLHSGLSIVPSSKYIIDFFIQNFIYVGSVMVFFGLIRGIIRGAGNGKNESIDILIAISLSQLTFILLSGPDWMEAFRFVVPIIPILSVMTALFITNLGRKKSITEKPLAAILIFLQAAGFWFFITHNSSSAPLWAMKNNTDRVIPEAQNYPWFAKANTHHLRDIPVAEALNKTVTGLLSVVGDRPVVITSYQAGFVIYHVAKEHYGRIRFIDLAGLVDDTITKCPPLRTETRRLRNKAARKQQLGHLEVARYLITQSNKAQTCFSPHPDIIYMLGSGIEFSPMFQELGYELAFTSTGDISLDFGNRTFYGGYLVDRTLFEKAGLKFERSDISIGYH